MVRGLLYFASVVVAALSASQAAEAAIGLKCSQWLDARTYLHYDARTKQITNGRPPTARPMSEDVDARVAWANWYITGHYAARFLLDKQLGYLGAAVGQNGPDDAIREMQAIDDLCRTGLAEEQRDYDVAEVVDRRAQAAIVARAVEIKTMLERSAEAGRRQGARSR
jgi:hypothetical protein